MCSSNLMEYLAVSVCFKLILFKIFKCERDLECLKSFGPEGGLKEELYFTNVLSLEKVRDLYL